ncbi:DUF4931 domain-containing protein [Desulfosediminicola flagellatus]|uniref:galactose-1-phosphate uridylyltransferase n=1 Tax=Desulfosediminicola flagellatus TaxID=2569541 RepID=UPI0010AC064D|nr:DUF4931 domain-containing protein [Desulfosediminicola flagellatus]
MVEERVREIRLNPIIPIESVLIASARGARPVTKHESFEPDRRTRVDGCPFCSGNEDQTPEESLREPDSKEWQIRVVRNLYPVLDDDHNLPGYELGMHRVIEGYGRHEVVIDHRNHGIQIYQMDAAHIGAILVVYRERMKKLYQSAAGHSYVLIFKNYGPASGGSIAHTHSQIIAMPIIPANVEIEISSSRKLYSQYERCIFCMLIDENLSYETTVYDPTDGPVHRSIEVGRYIVDKNESFVAIKPFASRFPWEIHILPRIHSHDFRKVTDAECMDFAILLQRVMARLQVLLGVVQYNFFLHSAPAKMTEADHQACFHWHLEICPRTTIPNGFELGSGLAINTLSPEEAVRRLREAD